MAYERLTDDDIEKLVSVMLDLSSEQPDSSFFQLFSQAQEKVLPPAKRYTRNVIQQRNKWSVKLKDALKGAGVWPGYVPDETKPEEQSSTAPSGPFSLLSDRPAPMLPVVQQTPRQGPVELIEQLYQTIRTDLKSDIMQEMTSQIEDQVRLQLRAALISAEELGANNDIVVTEPVKISDRLEVPVSIPRIFIIGLLPEQTLILRRKMHGVNVDLRFWKNEANTKLTQYSDWADHIFVMANFVSHTHIHAINNYRKKIKYCNGAVTDLERQIRFILTEIVG
jgi:hypothetical protein